MNKAQELEYVDDFITAYNSANKRQEKLIRVSDLDQEKPDTIAVLNGLQRIGIETSFIIKRSDLPYNINEIKPETINRQTAIDSLRERIIIKNQKLINIYKPENPQIKQFWLLLIGISIISTKELEEELKKQPIEIEFDRVYIYKGLCCDADIIEFKNS